MERSSSFRTEPSGISRSPVLPVPTRLPIPRTMGWPTATLPLYRSPCSDKLVLTVVLADSGVVHLPKEKANEKACSRDPDVDGVHNSAAVAIIADSEPHRTRSTSSVGGRSLLATPHLAERKPGRKTRTRCFGFPGADAGEGGRCPAPYDRARKDLARV